MPGSKEEDFKRHTSILHFLPQKLGDLIKCLAIDFSSDTAQWKLPTLDELGILDIHYAV